jgi:hypothetical protein
LGAAAAATARHDADGPIVFVAWPNDVFAMNQRLNGFTFNGLLLTWNAAAWSF